jgi:hypothetical protein
MTEVLYTFPGPKERAASTGGSNFAALVSGIPQACQWLLWSLLSLAVLGAIATPTILAVTNLQVVEEGSGEQGSGSGEVSPPPPGDILMGDPSPGGVGADVEFVFSPSSPPSAPPAPGEMYECLFTSDGAVVASAVEGTVVTVQLQPTTPGLTLQQQEIANVDINGGDMTAVGCSVLTSTIRNAEGVQNYDPVTNFLKRFRQDQTGRVSLTHIIYFDVELEVGASECSVTMKGSEFQWNGVVNMQKTFALTVTPPSPPPSPPAPAAPECAIAGGLCPDAGWHTNPGLGDVDLGTEASSMHEDATYREQCRAYCGETQGCNYYSLQWSSSTGVIRCKLCATNQHYYGTYLDQAALYGACNPPTAPPPSPPPVGPRTAKVQAHPSTLNLTPGECGTVRWTLDEPLLAVGEPGFLLLYFSSMTNTGVAFTPDMLQWDQNSSWHDVKSVEVCTHPMHTNIGTTTYATSVLTNTEYYSGFVPNFVLSVGYR